MYMMKKKNKLQKLLHVLIFTVVAVLISVCSVLASSDDGPVTKTIRFSYSLNGNPVIAQTEVEVPWFSLEPYGLEQFNRYQSASFEEGGGYINDTLVEEPTVLHSLIRMHEYAFNGGDPMPEDEEQEQEEKLSTYLQCQGSPTSLFITKIFGEDTYNLMYYVNHSYPLMAAGWGSTADYILLNDGDTVDFAVFDNWNFWTDGAFMYFDSEDYYLTADAAQTVTVYGTPTYAVSDGSTAPAVTESGVHVALLEVDGNGESNYQILWTSTAVTDSNGSFSLDLSTVGINFQEGDEYVLAAFDPEAGTDSANRAPAFAKLHITAAQAELADVSLNVPANTTLHAQQNYQLNPVIFPSNANATITYASSDENVATVSPSGLVTAKTLNTPANVTITCTATQGNTIKTSTATFQVLVGTMAQNVTLDHHYMEIPYDTTKPADQQLTGTLTATLTPSDASNTTINWTPYLQGSSSVALVGYATGQNQVGVVHPIGIGVEKVIGASQMNANLYDTCLVAVGGKFGDANGDGVVDEEDLFIVSSMVAAGATSGSNFAFLDFDMDGTITDYDYVMTDAVANGGIVPYVVE